MYRYYAFLLRAVLEDQTREYLLALQWILHYYFNGVQSWSWFYPQHYAPYVSDLRNLSHLDLQFDLSKPFLPFEQLMAVLPSASKALLPEPYQVNPSVRLSPLQDRGYFTRQFIADADGGTLADRRLLPVGVRAGFERQAAGLGSRRPHSVYRRGKQ